MKETIRLITSITVLSTAGIGVGLIFANRSEVVAQSQGDASPGRIVTGLTRKVTPRLWQYPDRLPAQTGMEGVQTRKVTPRLLQVLPSEIRNAGYGLMSKTPLLEYRWRDYETGETWYDYIPVNLYSERRLSDTEILESGYSRHWGPIMQIRKFGESRHLMVYSRGTFGEAVKRTARLVAEPSLYSEWTLLSRERLNDAVRRLTGSSPDLSAIVHPRAINSNWSEEILAAQSVRKLPDLDYTIDKRVVLTAGGRAPAQIESYEAYDFLAVAHGRPLVMIAHDNNLHLWRITVHTYKADGDLEGQQVFLIRAGQLVSRWALDRLYPNVGFDSALEPDERVVVREWLNKRWKVFRQSWPSVGKNRRSRLVAFDPKAAYEGPVEMAERVSGSVVSSPLKYDRYGNATSNPDGEVPSWNVWRNAMNP